MFRRGDTLTRRRSPFLPRTNRVLSASSAFSMMVSRLRAAFGVGRSPGDGTSRPKADHGYEGGLVEGKRDWASWRRGVCLWLVLISSTRRELSRGTSPLLYVYGSVGTLLIVLRNDATNMPAWRKETQPYRNTARQDDRNLHGSERDHWWKWISRCSMPWPKWSAQYSIPFDR